MAKFLSVDHGTYINLDLVIKIKSTNDRSGNPRVEVHFSNTEVMTINTELRIFMERVDKELRSSN